MDKTNIIAIVFGAGITLITTVIVTILQSYLQKKNAEASRKWQIEDRKREERSAIRKKKVNYAETSLKKLYDIAIKITEWETDVSTYLHVVKISGSYLGVIYLYKNGANSNLTKYLESKNFNKKKLIKKVTVEKAAQIIKDEFDQLDKFRLRQVEIINELDSFSNEIGNLFSTSLEVSKKINKYYDLLMDEIRNIERLLDIKKIAKIEQGKEIARIAEFRSKSSQFYGEISNLLDRYVLED